MTKARTRKDHNRLAAIKYSKLKREDLRLRVDLIPGASRTVAINGIAHRFSEPSEIDTDGDSTITLPSIVADQWLAEPKTDEEYSHD